ncbi:MAG: hypothetical protein GPOALKHO_001352 [Sodalis sp.]|nr:MAG: hypothetical protein GPOALKHO_001352 [Sodalis sp.]
MLEPRRLADKNVALRLAEQLGNARARRPATGCTTRAAAVRQPGWGGDQWHLTRQLQQDPALDSVSLR